MQAPVASHASVARRPKSALAARANFLGRPLSVHNIPGFVTRRQLNAVNSLPIQHSGDSNKNGAAKINANTNNFNEYLSQTFELVNQYDQFRRYLSEGREHRRLIKRLGREEEKFMLLRRVVDVARQGGAKLATLRAEDDEGNLWLRGLAGLANYADEDEADEARWLRSLGERKTLNQDELDRLDAILLKRSKDIKNYIATTWPMV